MRKNNFPLFFLVLLSFLSYSGFSQSADIQQLQTQVEEASGGAKIDLLLQLAKKLTDSDLKEAIDQAQDAYKLSNKAKDNLRIYQSGMLLGSLEKQAKRYKRAARYTDAAAIVAKNRRAEEDQLKAYAQLIEIYKADNEPNKLQQVGAQFRRIRDKLDLEKKKVENAELQEDLAETETILGEVSLERDKYEIENIVITDSLSRTIAEKAIKERNLAMLSEEKARLEMVNLELENESMKNELAIAGERQKVAESQARIRRQQMLLGLLGLGLLASLSFIVLLNRYHKLKRAREEERASLQKQLMLKEKMATLGEMTAGIAHEIKNPLNFVNNFAEGSTFLIEELEEVLEENKSKIEPDQFELFEELVDEIKKNSEDILGHGQRADRIVSSMMEHARGDKGVPTPTDINQLIKDNVDLAYSGYRSNHPMFQALIKKDLDPKLPRVMMVPQEIGRVILNLVNNALDALRDKREKLGNEFIPEINISTKLKGEQLLISVKDNGPGMEEDQRAKIFNPFFTTKPTGQGNTGLGLSISYDIIVQGHEGEISVNSEAGEYAEFLIQLPANKTVSV